MNAQYKITPASLRKNKKQRERLNYHLGKMNDSTLRDVTVDHLEAVYTEEHGIFTGDEEIEKEQLILTQDQSRNQDTILYLRNTRLSSEERRKDSARDKDHHLDSSSKERADNKAISQNNRYDLSKLGRDKSQSNLNTNFSRAYYGPLVFMARGFDKLITNQHSLDKKLKGQFGSSHHFIMNHKSQETAPGTSTNQRQDISKKAHYRSQLDESHPYDSMNLKDNFQHQSRQSVIEKNKQQLSQISIARGIGMAKEAQSTSRSFFQRRPKTQMLEINSNSTYNQVKRMHERKQTHLDENSLEQIEQEHTVFGDTLQSQLRNNKTFEIANNTSIIENNNQMFPNSGLIKIQNQYESLREVKLSQQLEKQQFKQKILRKQIDQIKRYLDESEQNFEVQLKESNHYTSHEQISGYQDLLKIYQSSLSDFSSKVLKKVPYQQQLFERIIEGINLCNQKIQYNMDLEIKGKRIELSSFQKEIEVIKKQNLELQAQIAQEQEYLQSMFEKTKQEGLSKMVSDWEGMKTLADSMKESNLAHAKNLIESGLSPEQFDEALQNLANSSEGQKFLNDYSGVMLQLKDLYSIMRGGVYYDKQNEHHNEIKVDQIVEKIESDINQKIKNIQKASALKVLKRYYKKVVLVDQATAIDQDPLILEKERLERMIQIMRDERDTDMRKITQLNEQIKQMNKSQNTLSTQVREAKSALNKASDTIEQKEGEIKEVSAQLRYANEQTAKFQDQVKELVAKCDYYESRIEVYKETQILIDQSLTRKRAKKQRMKNEIQTLKERIQKLEDEAKVYEAKIRVFEKQTNPERKRIIMVKKPIFDADGNQIGEGLVEQIVTLRTDESVGALAYQKSEIDYDEGSNLSLNSEEAENMAQFFRENGIPDDEIPTKEKHSGRLSTWLKVQSQGEGSEKLEKLAQQYKEKIKQDRRVKRRSTVNNSNPRSLLQENSVNASRTAIGKGEQSQKSLNQEQRHTKNQEVKDPEKLHPNSSNTKSSVSQQKSNPQNQRHSIIRIQEKPTATDQQKHQAKSSQAQSQSQPKQEAKQPPKVTIEDTSKQQNQDLQAVAKDPFQQESIQHQLDNGHSRNMQLDMKQSLPSENVQEPVVVFSQKSRDNQNLTQISTDRKKEQTQSRMDEQNDLVDHDLYNQSQEINKGQESRSSFKKVNRMQSFKSGTRQSNHEQSFDQLINEQRQRADSLNKSQTRSGILVKGMQKGIQTDVTGDILQKSKKDLIAGKSITTQTEQFMFPLEDELKRRVMELIGGRLPKHGDSYDKGSAFFTRASALLDELEARFVIDVEKDHLTDKEYRQLRMANGLQDPKYKNFIPVLKKQKRQNQD